MIRNRKAGPPVDLLSTDVSLLSDFTPLEQDEEDFFEAGDEVDYDKDWETMTTDDTPKEKVNVNVNNFSYNSNNSINKDVPVYKSATGQGNWVPPSASNSQLTIWRSCANFSWAQLWEIFMQSLQRMWFGNSTASNSSSSAASSSNKQFSLADLDIPTRSTFEQFKTYSNQPYNSENARHEAQLMEYWAMCNPQETPLSSRKSEQWKHLGFQGIDPASDFRGPGIFGLRNLLYMAHRYPVLFAAMLKSTQKIPVGTKSLDPRAALVPQIKKEGYPFSIAGLNVVVVLFEFLGWGFKSTQRSGQAKRQIIQLLLEPSDRVYSAYSSSSSPSSSSSSSASSSSSSSSSSSASKKSADLLIDFSDLEAASSKQKDSLYHSHQALISFDADQENQEQQQQSDPFGSEKEERLVIKPDDDFAIFEQRMAKLAPGSSSSSPSSSSSSSSSQKKSSAYWEAWESDVPSETLRGMEENFAELFCLTFSLLDKEWWGRDEVGYFDFPSVLEATAQNLQKMLETSLGSMEAVREYVTRVQTRVPNLETQREIERLLRETERIALDTMSSDLRTLG